MEKYVGDKIRFTGKIYDNNHKEPHAHKIN